MRGLSPLKSAIRIFQIKRSYQITNKSYISSRQFSGIKTPQELQIIPWKRSQGPSRQQASKTLSLVAVRSMVGGGGEHAGQKPNRLAQEESPYLLQHAYNPVDWLPWGPEAFDLARERDVPIFLSIGYSTCHWCHVMERESFESDSIAALLNTNFVPVKVDREERPDVDKLYMTYIQATRGGGEWHTKSIIIFNNVNTLLISFQSVVSFRLSALINAKFE